jgi:putative endonuclease
MEYNFWVYIMASQSWTLYIGMTNDLIRRVLEHKEGKIEWFTKKYGCTRLVYYEHTKYVYDAISREKQLKHFLRKEKEELIKNVNPHWKDLYSEITS